MIVAPWFVLVLVLVPLVVTGVAAWYCVAVAAGWWPAVPDATEGRPVGRPSDVVVDD